MCFQLHCSELPPASAHTTNPAGKEQIIKPRIGFPFLFSVHLIWFQWKKTSPPEVSVISGFSREVDENYVCIFYCILYCNMFQLFKKAKNT
jgi:hypothetical protein